MSYDLASSDETFNNMSSLEIFSAGRRSLNTRVTTYLLACLLACLLTYLLTYFVSILVDRKELSRLLEQSYLYQFLAEHIAPKDRLTAGRVQFKIKENKYYETHYSLVTRLPC